MQYRRSSEIGGENMSRKPYSWLVVVGMISLCIGLSGCGKNVDIVAESTVPNRNRGTCHVWQLSGRTG